MLSAWTCRCPWPYPSLSIHPELPWQWCLQRAWSQEASKLSPLWPRDQLQSLQASCKMRTRAPCSTAIVDAESSVFAKGPWAPAQEALWGQGSQVRSAVEAREGRALAVPGPGCPLPPPTGLPHPARLCPPVSALVGPPAPARPSGCPWRPSMFTSLACVLNWADQKKVGK